MENSNHNLAKLEHNFITPFESLGDLPMASLQAFTRIGDVLGVPNFVLWNHKPTKNFMLQALCGEGVDESDIPSVIDNLFSWLQDTHNKTYERDRKTEIIFQLELMSPVQGAEALGMDQEVREIGQEVISGLSNNLGIPQQIICHHEPTRKFLLKSQKKGGAKREKASRAIKNLVEWGEEELGLTVEKREEVELRLLWDLAAEEVRSAFQEYSKVHRIDIVKLWENEEVREQVRALYKDLVKELLRQESETDEARKQFQLKFQGAFSAAQ